MNPWLQWMGSGFLGVLVMALVNAFFNRRKLSADATKIIADAASGVVEIQRAELARVLASNTMLNGKVEAQKIRLDQVEREQRSLGEAVVIHAYWDSQVVDIAREHDIDLPPPPPLTTGG